MVCILKIIETLAIFPKDVLFSPSSAQRFRSLSMKVEKIKSDFLSLNEILSEYFGEEWVDR